MLVMSLIFLVSLAVSLVLKHAFAPYILFTAASSLQLNWKAYTASLQVIFWVSCMDMAVTYVCLWDKVSLDPLALPSSQISYS